MASEKEREYHGILFGAIVRVANEALRGLFKNKWKSLYDTEWPESPAGAHAFSTLYKLDLRKIQKSQFDSGRTSGWDTSLLQQLLKLLTSKVAPIKESKAVDKIVEIRNFLAHSPSGLVSKKDFEEKWKELRDSIAQIGGDLELLQHILVEKADTAALAGGTQDASMLALKEKGNRAVKEEQFDEALACYTSALELPNISTTDRAVLHANRSQVYIRKANGSNSDMLNQAYVEAKMAQALLPTWFRPYARKGQIQFLQGKLQKSVSSYDYALALSPNNTELKDARSVSLDTLRRQERFEHLDQAYMPQGTAVDLELMGLDLNHDKMEVMLSDLERKGSPIAFLVRAHQARDSNPPDFKKAIMLYEKAANNGNAEAMYNLGVFYQKGMGTERNFQKAISLWEKAAGLPPTKGLMTNVGVANSQHALGLAYLDGIGVDKNVTTALHYFNKAAGNGYPGSLNTLGALYGAGEVVVKDLNKSMQYYLAAAAKGETAAMHNIGQRYVRGVGVKQDIAEGMKWLQKAAEKGHGRASILLNQNRTEWEKKIKLEEQLSKEDPAMVKAMQDHFSKLYSNDNPQYMTVTEEDPYPYEELKLYANHSSTAAAMFRAKQHFILATSYVTEAGVPGVDVATKYVSELAKAYAITELVVRVPPNATQLAELVLKHDSSNSDALMCQVFGSTDHGKNIAIIKTCIMRNITFPRMYPSLAAQYSFQGKWWEALEAQNKAIELEPENFKLLYMRAVCYRFLEKYAESKKEYERYIRVIDPADRKIPDSYYGICYCLMSEEKYDEAEQTFMIGRDKESKLLPYFKRQPSQIGAQLDELFNGALTQHLKAKKKGITSANTTAPSVPNSSPSNLPATANAKFSDPRRIELINRHRDWFTMVRKESELEFVTNSPPKKQKMPSSLTNLKPLFISDVDLAIDKVHSGFCLSVVIIDRLSKSVGAYTIVEDEKGGIERVGFYNFGFKSVDDANKFFWIGKRISIIDPYLRRGNDGMPFFRVDDPASVISHSTTPTNVCALCLQESATLLKCNGCKKSFYCNRTCQQTDWKVFGHKKMCY